MTSKLAEISVESTEMRFHHVQIYAHALKPLCVYKALEEKMNAFHSSMGFTSLDAQTFDGARGEELIQRGRILWEEMSSSKGSNESVFAKPFEATNQDLVEQLICGLGFRIVAHNGFQEDGKTMDPQAQTCSVFITSKDACGAGFLITAPCNPLENSTSSNGVDDSSDRPAKRVKTSNSTEEGKEEERKGDAVGDRDGNGWCCSPENEHFSLSKYKRFLSAHNGRQGIAVLAFEVEKGIIEGIYHRYVSMNPSFCSSFFFFS